MKQVDKLKFMLVVLVDAVIMNMDLELLVVIIGNMNDEYYDKFFDIYVTDEHVYKCKKESR